MSSKTDCGLQFNAALAAVASGYSKRSTCDINLRIADSAANELHTLVVSENDRTGTGAHRPIEDFANHAKAAFAAMTESAALKPYSISWDEIVLRHHPGGKLSPEHSVRNKRDTTKITLQMRTLNILKNGVHNPKRNFDKKRKIREERIKHADEVEADAQASINSISYARGEVDSNARNEQASTERMKEEARGTTNSNKRYIFASEITIAFLIAAAGATKLKSRARKGPFAELIPGSNSEAEDKSAKRNIGVDPPSFQLLPFDPNANPNPDSDPDMDLDLKTETETEHVIRSSMPKFVQLETTIRSQISISAEVTLSDIAETLYYDRDVAWLIADINTLSIKETWMNGKRVVEFQSAQQIDLPTSAEVARFLREKHQSATAANLIAIVEKSTVDPELISNTLDTLLS